MIGMFHEIVAIGRRKGSQEKRLILELTICVVYVNISIPYRCNISLHFISVYFDFSLSKKQTCFNVV